LGIVIHGHCHGHGHNYDVIKNYGAGITFNLVVQTYCYITKTPPLLTTNKQVSEYIKMKTSEKIDEIATALSSFQSNVPTIQKNKTAGSNAYSYKYADIADVLKSIRESLSINGLSVSQSAESSSESINNVIHEYVTVTTMIMHNSGQWLKSSLRGSVNANQGRMSNMQSIGSITTYLRRYSLASMLGLATDDDVDGNLGDTTQSNAQTETDNYRNAAMQAVAQIQNVSVVQWCNEYLKKNRGLEQMKKIHTIASWQVVIDTKIAEVINSSQYLKDEDSQALDGSIQELQAKRVDFIENDGTIVKIEAIAKRVNEKIDELNA
jgi:hypothetical protein